MKKLWKKLFAAVLTGVIMVTGAAGCGTGGSSTKKDSKKIIVGASPSPHAEILRAAKKVLKEKGIIRKGRLEFVEKNKSDKKIIILEITNEIEQKLDEYIKEIDDLIKGDVIPDKIESRSCKKCAYFEYCYI